MDVRNSGYAGWLEELIETLMETKPEDFDHDEWKALREAIKAMREKLDAMEEMIDRAETEADEYDEDAGEDRYETYWA